MKTAIVLLALLLLAPQALAHNQSQGWSRFQVRGNVVEVELGLLAADYHQLLGLDLDEDHILTQDEAHAGEPALATFLPQTLRLLVDEERVPCSGRFLMLDTEAGRGLPPLYPSRLRFECPAPPSTLRIRFGVFNGSGIRHVNLGTVEVPERTAQVVFTPDQHEATVVLRAEEETWQTARRFWLLGVEHIVTGYDHLLFLLTLLLVARRFRDLVLVVTSFTLAHSVTLCLAALGVASLPGNLVEPAIAASIVYVAVENGFLLARNVTPRLPRASLAFLFGLIHGFGFAGALETAGLPREGLVIALAMFNVGVESGQLAFCALAYAGVVLMRRGPWGRTVALWLSALAALCGAYWFVVRVVGT